MVFEELTAVLPSPRDPIEVPAADRWGSVTDALGFALPVDYMQFIETYGTGSINRFLWVFSPFSANPNLNLLQQLPRVLGAFRALKETDPTAIGMPLLFEPGGLMPWGATDNGDYLCWRTVGASGRP